MGRLCVVELVLVLMVCVVPPLVIETTYVAPGTLLQANVIGDATVAPATGAVRNGACGQVTPWTIFTVDVDELLLATGSLAELVTVDVLTIEPLSAITR